MRRTHYLPSMVQAITVLTVLKMLTNAQTNCNQGIGRIVYERLPDQQLQGFDDDVLRDTSPPWEVLSKCQDLCLKDRTSSNNLVRVCSSFDFLPGARLTSFGSSAAYEESKCYLTREQAYPEGIGTLALVPKSVHFTEVCLSSSRVETECPQRRYVFERHPRKALRLETPDFKEVRAANRSDCEDKCLNEYGFVCRSATFDKAGTCSLSRFTRRTHPQFFMDSSNSDYLENTCLNGERRCDATLIFVKEETKRLTGPWEAASLANTSLEDCQAECVSGASDKFFCRAIHYDENTRVCSLLEEDSFSQGEPQASASPTHHLYDLICLDNGNESFLLEAHPFRAESPTTSHLFLHGRRPDTAFQRYRNSRLGGDFHSEITGQSLSECLDECLRQTSFVCRSAVYSAQFRNCRLSRFSQKDGHRVIYDADYDYYENLMAHYPENDLTPGYRPDPIGQGSQYPTGRPQYTPPGGVVGIYSEPGFGTPHPAGNGVGFGGQAVGIQVEYPYGHPVAPGRPAPGGPGTVHSYPPNPYLYQPGPVASPGGYPPAAPHPGPVLPPGVYNDPFYGSASRPEISRCEEGDAYRQVAQRFRAKRPFVRKFVTAPTLTACERECSDARDFVCRTFNFRPYTGGFGAAERENCELSDRDSRLLDISSSAHFENSPDFDFYERSYGRAANQGECLDVMQVCSEDGMVFTLRTPDRFFGRIYTHGYYDRCFFHGNGGFVNVFRINGPKGFPDCGTQRYGDTMTNIVIVQFSDSVQTGRDKRYNLTCVFRDAGEALVTSGYIGSRQNPIPQPIEFLPAENSLTSKVDLQILYQGRPTTAIAVGDPLTFRLEARGGFNTPTDIFATNVIARDPYSGKIVQLIDQYGCPVDNFVFPALDRSREGDGLEARFNAFKIPESNFLVFEAHVRTCRDGCQPAYCSGAAGRSEPSFGRRRRRGILDDAIEGPSDNDHDPDIHDPEAAQVVKEKKATDKAEGLADDEEQVREMFEVYESRHDMPDQSSGRSAAEEKSADVARLEALLESGDVILSGAEFYALVTSLALMLLLVLCGSIGVGLAYRRYRPLLLKHADDRSVESACSQDKTSFIKLSGLSAFISNRTSVSRSGGMSPAALSAMNTGISDNSIPSSQHGRRGTFEDPSEPIYTDPSLFERPRSMRSLAPSTTGHTSVEY